MSEITEGVRVYPHSADQPAHSHTGEQIITPVDTSQTHNFSHREEEKQADEKKIELGNKQ